MGKVCIKCRISQDENEFSFKNQAIGKRHGRCKTCQRKDIKGHYDKNIQYYVDKALQQRIDVKQQLDTYKRTLSCVDCGLSFKDEPYLCDFHHLNNKLFDIAMGPKTRTWKKTLEEIAKCVPICPICHRRRHCKERQNMAP